jgi:membrane-bound ClpP family serine protease
MNAISLLFLIGVIFLGFEVFVPGAILGIFGVLAMLIGCGLAFADYGTGGGAIAVAVALGLVAVMLYAEFVLLPKTAIGQRLFLKASINGTTNATRPVDLTGRSGKTVTALAPTGYVMIEGAQHEAYSQSGFLEAGVPVKVIRADNFRLIVTQEK